MPVPSVRTFRSYFIQPAQNALPALNPLQDLGLRPNIIRAAPRFAHIASPGARMGNTLRALCATGVSDDQER